MLSSLLPECFSLWTSSKWVWHGGCTAADFDASCDSEPNEGPACLISAIVSHPARKKQNLAVLQLKPLVTSLFFFRRHHFISTRPVFMHHFFYCVCVFFYFLEEWFFHPFFICRQRHSFSSDLFLGDDWLLLFHTEDNFGLNFGRTFFLNSRVISLVGWLSDLHFLDHVRLRKDQIQLNPSG